MKRILGTPRNVFLLGLVSFFNDFSAEMIQSVMPIFLKSVLGAPVFFVGLIEGVSDALSSVLKVFSGWVSDRTRKRKLPAVIGYGLAVATRPFLALTTAFSQVFGLRVIDRIGKGLRDAPRDALIVESSQSGELGRSFGVHRALDTLGATLGPLLAFLLLPFLGEGAEGMRKLFWVAFFIGLAAIASFVFIKEEKNELPGFAAKKPPLDWSLLKKNRKFLFIVLSLFVFGLGTLPIGLLLLKASDVGVPIAQVPLMYFVYSLTFVIAAVPLGKLADTIGERAVIFAGFLIASAAYFALAGTESHAQIAGCFALLGLYSAATDGVQRVLAARYVQKSLLATGQGFINMAIGFSSLGAGVVGGVLWTAYGDYAALLYAAAFSLTGAILFWMLSGGSADTEYEKK